MNIPKIIKKTYVWVLVGILFVETAFLFYQYHFARFDILHVKPHADFQYSDSLSCEVMYSTFRKIGESLFDSYYVEPTFTIEELDTEMPKLQWVGFENELKKTSENESMVILQTVPIDSRDTHPQVIQIFKERGTFVRSFMGGGQYFGAREFLHPDGFQFIIAQKGRCR